MFLYISAFMLYFIFIFSMNLVFFYEIFYNDVSAVLWRPSFYFLTDPNENCASCIKLEIKDILFMRILDFLNIYWENYDLLRKSLLWCSYPTPLPPSPLGRPLRWVLLGTHLSHTWGYFFNTKKNNNGLYQNHPPPLFFGHPIGPLKFG